MIQKIKNLMCYFGFHKIEYAKSERNMSFTLRKVTYKCCNKNCNHEITKIYKLGKLRVEV